MHSYLESRRVNPQLKKRIQHYYKYMWNMHSTTSADPEHILADLHPNLRFQVNLCEVTLTFTRVHVRTRCTQRRHRKYGSSVLR